MPASAQVCSTLMSWDMLRIQILLEVAGVWGPRTAVGERLRFLPPPGSGSLASSICKGNQRARVTGAGQRGSLSKPESPQLPDLTVSLQLYGSPRPPSAPFSHQTPTLLPPALCSCRPHPSCEGFTGQRAPEPMPLGSQRAGFWAPRAGRALGPACVSKCPWKVSWFVNIHRSGNTVTSQSCSPGAASVRAGGSSPNRDPPTGLGAWQCGREPSGRDQSGLSLAWRQGRRGGPVGADGAGGPSV